MRKAPLIVALAGLVLMLAAPTVLGDNSSRFKASLNGYLETPSVSTNGHGRFELRIRGDTITYKLSYDDLTAAPLFAHIHFARPDVAGGVAAFLCGGSTKPAPCPESGVVRGTIVAADVVGPAGQGIAAGEFRELVRAIRNGATYANVHTPLFPAGEIRGNIRR